MLTQLSSVKTRLGIQPSDTADDIILTNAILAVSARAALECNRIFDRAANATFEFSDGECELNVDRYPIESVSLWETKLTEAGGWITQTPDYLIRTAGGIACIISLTAPMGNGTGLGRVTFTGGYVPPGTTPGTGQTALPDGIEQAIIEQVAYWYQNKDRLGVTALGGSGGSLTQFSQLDLLPSVKNTLQKYRRLNP